MRSTSWRNSGSRRLRGCCRGHRDLGGDAARVGGQHDDAVAHQHRFLDVVRHHEDRLDGHAALDPQVEKVGAQRLGGEHVERRKRLVHQQDLRVDDERAGEADALAHAAGELLGKRRFEPVEADEVDRRERPFARLRLRHLARAQADFDVGEHGEPGEQRKALEHHGQAIDRTRDGRVVVGHRALRRQRQPGNDAQQGGLAAAGTAEQADDLARRQLQRHAVEDRRPFLARAGLIALADVGDLEQRALAFLQHGG